MSRAEQEREAAALFLGTCGPVTRANYQEHVANAEYDARSYGWSLETIGALRAELARRFVGAQ